MPTDLIFDFFGTLVQYTAGAFHTAPYERTHAYLLDHGFTIDYATFVSVYDDAFAVLEQEAKQTFREYHMDDSARAFFQMAFQQDVSPAILDGFVAAFIAEWSRGIWSKDGIQPFVADLAQRYRLSIISNTHYPALIHDNLARMGVAAYFSQIVTSVEFGQRKPHTSIFQHALANLAISAEDALYVGDSYSDDYEGAIRAGIRTVLIDPRNQYPHVVDRITSLFELRDVLGQPRPAAEV